MTYTVGGLIQAVDYNGFASTTAGANVNDIFSTGSGDKGYGGVALTTVSAAGIVTATNWAGLVNNIATLGTHTGTSITSRSAPTTGNLIEILTNLNTDLTNITTNRGNAAASGTETGIFTGSISKETATGSGTAAFTITFTHTVTFASENARRFFFNAGGILRLKYGKSSTGTDADADWNTLSGKVGTISLTGRVNSTTNTIAGQAYTGTTRLGGTGGTQTTLATTTGFYQLTGSPITIFQLNDDVAPYSGEFIRTTATATSGTVITLVTTWVSDGSSGAGTSANISGGTATSSPSTTITGTAPTTLVTVIPPSQVNFTIASPTIAATVA